ncbi:MAG: Maf family protein [Clostridiales bacterium]|jgi:septum formation protein|nr:Maf family protein [Clostridiales bacterium]
MKEIILASSSPRRHELLDQVGIEHKVMKSKFMEKFDEYSLPHEIVVSFALKKAEYVAKMVDNNQTIVIGADTLVVYKGQILGKPRNAKNARQMLEMLNDQTHEVLTGFAVIDVETGKTVTDYESTLVKFREISPKELAAYAKSNESRDKAGGYAIQGKAAKFIESIEGEYSTVVGLPLSRLTQVLEKEFKYMV